MARCLSRFALAIEKRGAGNRLRSPSIYRCCGFHFFENSRRRSAHEWTGRVSQRTGRALAVLHRAVWVRGNFFLPSSTSFFTLDPHCRRSVTALVDHDCPASERVVLVLCQEMPDCRLHDSTCGEGRLGGYDFIHREIRARCIGGFCRMVLEGSTRLGACHGRVVESEKGKATGRGHGYGQVPGSKRGSERERRCWQGEL